VVPALEKLVADKTVDEFGTNAGAVHALWVIHGLGLVSDRAPLVGGRRAERQLDDLMTAALTSQDPAVRRAAATVFARVWFSRASFVLTHLAAEEPDPTVQRALLLALADRSLRESGSQFGDAVVVALGRPELATDPALRDAVTVAAATHPEFTTRLRPLKRPSPAALRVIETAVASAARTQKPWPINLSTTLARLPDVDPAVAAAVVAGLADGWPAGNAPALTPEGEAGVATLLTKLPTASRGKLLKLASTWGAKGIDEQLATLTKAAFATLADVKARDADRIAAAQQVIEFQPASDEAATKLLDAVAADASPELAGGIIEVLAQSKAKNLGAAIVAKLKDLPAPARPVALRLVLAKTDSVKAFLDAVEKGTLRFDMLALDQRTALASHPDTEISARARKILELGGGLPNADRQKVIDELKSELAKSGNIENGKKMFLTHCAKCHKHGSEGTAIGPDLTGFGVHPKEELVIAILDPSRSVEGNFKLYRVTTADDRTILGILGAQTGTSVEIIDADAKRHALAKADIVTMKETDKSLMPEGFEKVMKPQELTDLLEFLLQKGKFVPLPLDKVATAISTKGMFYDESAPVERLIFPDWKPKMVGEVPFVLVDPKKDTVKNVILLHSENGKIPPTMPKSVNLPFNGKAKAIHILGGVGGWAAPFDNEKTVSMIVRITYDDGKTEDHELKNAVHIADYIRRVDVPESKFAFALRQQQVRYLSVPVKRPDAVVKTIEFVKGPDRTAPIVMAVTVETP
jgi:putative heme-binding domain-containing protein